MERQWSFLVSPTEKTYENTNLTFQRDQSTGMALLAGLFFHPPLFGSSASLSFIFGGRLFQ